ncbi:MAG: phosphoribosylformylglycinamidine synthase subunit PurS [Chloroflexota bacterium]|nr:phosphoribosylformylglycinamidine synthase subunit PurS [Chloroflexota bacterium]
MTDAAKDAVRTTGPAGLVWSVEVTVMPKPGINDPQGEAIRGGLRSLDHAGVISVRAGKSLRLRVEGESREAVEREAALMCDRLLANPVIETYEIHVEPAGDGEGSA